MNISTLNCLLDLHVHLDGSLSLKTIKQLAKIQNIDLNMDDKQLLQKLQVPDDCRDLNEYLSKFEFPLRLLQTKQAITESVRCLLEEQKQQGLIYSEIRFAPQLHTNKGLTQKDVIEAAIEGLHGIDDIDAGLILCCMRGDDKKQKESNLETVRMASEYLGKGVIAVDLAGAEGLYPTDRFRDIFVLANELKVPFTIHAGEAAGPESIKLAVEFGAKRIGHGVRCLEDPKVCQLLIDKNITLELCPTSNLNTKIFYDIKDYPIRQLIEKGIRITINTDNMMVSNTTIKKELCRLQQTFLLDDQTIAQLLYQAVDAAFTSAVVKKRLREKIEHILQGIK